MSSSSVYDMDNVYLSDRGWAYRHYKNAARTEFWDELLVAGEVASSDSPAAFGAAEPTFETVGGDTVQAPLPYIISLTIAHDGNLSAAAPEAFTSTLEASFSAAGATYQWSTSDASATIATETAAATTIDFSAAGDYTVSLRAELPGGDAVVETVEVTVAA